MCEFFIIRIPVDYLGKAVPAIGVIAIDDQLLWGFCFADVNNQWPRCVPPRYGTDVDKMAQKVLAFYDRKLRFTIGQWKTFLRTSNNLMRTSGPFKHLSDDVHQCVNDCANRYIYGQRGA
jgi:hypothetical protein